MISDQAELEDFLSQTNMDVSKTTLYTKIFNEKKKLQKKVHMFTSK
jgi:hypothetical protein